MTVASITCPNCGASLELKPRQELITCTYCNSNLHFSAEAGARPAVQHVTESAKFADSTFHMTVEDVFPIRNRGIVAIGRVSSGTLRIGDTIVIRRGNKTMRKTAITSIEMFHKMLDHANTGDNIGVQFMEIKNGEVQRGDVLSADGLDFS